MPSPRLAAGIFFVLLIQLPQTALPDSSPLMGIEPSRQTRDVEATRARFEALMPARNAAVPADVPVPEVGVIDGSTGEHQRWGGDILVADQVTDIEGNLNMAGDTAGRFFAIVESMDNTCINLFRSNDGGTTWNHYGWICGVEGNDVTHPDITVPEFTQDYLFIAYEYGGYAQITRINLSTNQLETFAVAPRDEDGPRITTDDFEFTEYYVYLIVDDEVHVSTDRGQSWSTSGNLHPLAQAIATPDIAFANDVLYATWFYVLAGAGDDPGLVPWGIAVRTSADYGLSWSPLQFVCEDCYEPRIAAVKTRDDAMIVYKVDNGGQHDDVKYAYTQNGGTSWNSDFCLSCQPAIDEEAPSIAADHTGYHATYLSSLEDIVYRWTPVTSVHSWPRTQVVNDTHEASPDYAPAAVAIEWQRILPGVAWSDTRTPTLATYFDRPGNHVYYVYPDGSGDVATIDDAANIAADGDTIRLGDGIFSGPGNHDISYRGKNMVIESISGDPSTCIIDCALSGPSYRAFVFANGESRDAELRGVTLRGGRQVSGGAIRMVGADPTIRDCIFEENHATDSGGAIVCNDAFPLIAGCRFIGNTADNAGGAIITGLPGAGGEYLDCVFQDNWALWGGGAIHLYGGSPDIGRCTFWRNSSDHWGGALHADRVESVPWVYDSTFCGNAAPQGAGIYTRNSAHVLVEDTIIAHSSEGQAVYCTSSGSVALSCSDIYGNAGGDWVGCIAGQAGANGNLALDPLLCSHDTGDMGLRAGSPCLPQNNSCGVLIGAHGQGCASTAAPDQASALRFRVLDNTPNPFSTMTSIRFELPAATEVDIDLFDVTGRHVRSLAQGTRYLSGIHAVPWDGRSADGRRAAAGVYYYRVRVHDVNVSRAMLLLH